jgi:hypothetical protein
MLKNKLSKKRPFIKSILFRTQKQKIYIKTLESEFSRLRLENDRLKKQLYV